MGHRSRCVVAVLLVSLACDDGATPRLDAIVPQSGRAGEAVHLLGDGFAADDATVAFAGRVARVISKSARRIIAEVPEGLAGAVSVVIKVDGRRTAPITFWVGDAPLGDGGL